MTACTSGKHQWQSEDDALRCCNGFTKVFALHRDDLVSIGAARIVPRGNRGYWGWLKIHREPAANERKRA